MQDQFGPSVVEISLRILLLAQRAMLILGICGPALVH